MTRPSRGGNAARVVDVAVLGGGPAGSAAARLLSLWGHSVLLVDRGARGRRALGESLPPSCTALLDVIGVRGAVERAGFVRATGNTVWWGDEPMRVESFAGGRVGYQVDRAVLDEVLRQCAAEGGAEVLSQTTARGVGPTKDGLVGVTLEGRAIAETQVAARWVLDCTGRSRLLARGDTGGRDAPRTLALVGRWERPGGWPVVDDSHTLVESGRQGWGWSVPVAGAAGRRFFTVMLDPTQSRVAGAGALRACYAEALARLRALGRLAEEGVLVGEPWGCDATPYEESPIAGERLLRVGDAASFIDPLSSFGVKKALASAWLAAVAVRTALETPSLESAALALVTARERAYAASASRALTALSRQAASPGGSDFWMARARPADGASAEGADEGDDLERVRDDPRVVAALGELRRRDLAVLQLADDVRLEPRPLVRGNRVALEPHLVAAGFPQGVRYVHNVDVVALARVAPQEREVGTLYARYEAIAGRAALPDFLVALGALVGRGVLRLA